MQERACRPRLPCHFTRPSRQVLHRSQTQCRYLTLMIGRSRGMTFRSETATFAVSGDARNCVIEHKHASRQRMMCSAMDDFKAHTPGGSFWRDRVVCVRLWHSSVVSQSSPLIHLLIHPPTYTTYTVFCILNVDCSTAHLTVYARCILRVTPPLCHISNNGTSTVLALV